MLLTTANSKKEVRCVAAPIRGGMIIGAIANSAPVLRFPKERYVVCADRVREAAQGNLGHVLRSTERRLTSMRAIFGPEQQAVLPYRYAACPKR
jgi:hypothetical protein